MKKPLSLLTAAVLAATALAMPAYAKESYETPLVPVGGSEKYELYVNGSQFNSDKLTIECGDGTAVFDGKHTLTLTNAYLNTLSDYPEDSNALYGVINSGIEDLTIVLEGENIIEGSNNANDGIDTAGGCSVTITGDGSLEINNAYYGTYIGYWEVPGGDLTVTDGAKLTVTNPSCAGIWVNHDINFTDCTAEVTKNDEGTYNGIVSNIGGTVTFTNSDVYVSTWCAALTFGNGDESKHAMVVNSGKVTLESRSPQNDADSRKGVAITCEPEDESQEINCTLTVNGGTLDVTADVQCTNIPEENIVLGSGVSYVQGSSLSDGGKVVISGGLTADQLPFEFDKPTFVSLSYVGEVEGNTLSVVYGQNQNMSAYFQRLGEYDTRDETLAELAEIGIEDIWIESQLDWSIDNTTDWHYNKYWDTQGYDADYTQHLGEWAYTDLGYSLDSANSAWIMRYMGNTSDPDDERWYGTENSPGWKDALGEGNYEIVKEDDDYSYAVINYDKHTVYFRMRYAAAYWAKDDPENIVHRIFTDWTDPACYGKDAPPWVEYTAEDIPAPEISDFVLTNEVEHHNPVGAITLTVPKSLEKINAAITACGGSVRIVADARIYGTEEWVTDIPIYPWWVIGGQYKFSLYPLAEAGKPLPENTPLEFRCRYYVDQYDQAHEWVSEFYSEYSDILSFGVEYEHWYKGDVNKDGKVDTLDLTLLARYLAKWPGYDKLVDPFLGELDGVEGVTVADYVILARCLAKWPNYWENYIVEVELPKGSLKT